jgi:hypothetical protein
MSTRSTPPAVGSPSALLVGAGVGTAAAAWLDAWSFAGFVSAALGAVVYISLAGSPGVMRLSATACAVSFPLLVVQAGETGLLWAATISLGVLAGASVLRGLRPGLVASLALALVDVVYISSLGSHLVLIKDFRSGSQMVTAFFLMVGAYEAASAMVAARRPEGRATAKAVPHGAWFDWRAGLGGALACEAVALGARTLIGLPLEVTAMLILGLVVAAAAALGSSIGSLVAEDLGARLSGREVAALRHLNAALVAAPAFYYGFRLYLS